MLRIDINLIFTVINVLVLCIAVRVFLWKPIHKILDQRQAQVDQDFADAAQAKAQAEAIVAEQESLRANIEQAKADAVSEATAQAKADAARIVATAKERAAAIVEDAEADAHSRKEAILRETQSEITEIIVAATAKVAGVPVGGDSDLYDAFLEKAGGSDE